MTSKKFEANIKPWFFPLLPRMAQRKYLKKFIIPKQILPSNFKIKLAQSLDEYLQAYQLIYKEYVKTGLMPSDQSEMRISFHDCLPTSNIVIAKIDGNVVATLGLISESELALPHDPYLRNKNKFPPSLKRVEAINFSCQSEYFSLAVPSLISYSLVFCKNYFQTKIIQFIIPSHLESFFNHPPYVHRIDDHIFSDPYLNNQQAFSFYIDLDYLDSIDKLLTGDQGLINRIDQDKEQANGHYFFPLKQFNTTQFPQMSAETMNILFNEKTSVFSHLSSLQKYHIRNIYSEYPHYLNIIPNFDLEYRRPMDNSRKELRFPVVCYGTATFDEGKKSSVIVQDASYGGLKAYGQLDLPLNTTINLVLEVGPYSFCELTVIVQWKNVAGIYGLEVIDSDKTWIMFNDFLKQQLHQISQVQKPTMSKKAS